MFDLHDIAIEAMRCYNLTMLMDQLSTTSYLNDIVKHDFIVDLKSNDGEREIAKLLNKTVLVGGKRLRPILTTLFGNLAKAPSDDILVLARAIEFVHAASLAHDDVIDNATTRRNKPSINIAGDNKMSILAGDYLLSQVINDLSLLGNIDLVVEMASIIKRLSLGEWLQHDCLKNRKYTSVDFKKISENKTSSVLEWCSVSPFLLAGYPSEVLEMARDFGRRLGLCFQLYDDLLDFSDSSAKDKFLDIKNDQLTYTSYLYLVQHNLLKDYEGGAKLLDLINFSELTSVLPEIKKQADHYHQECCEIFVELLSVLEISKDDKNAKAIRFLLEKLKNRTK